MEVTHHELFTYILKDQAEIFLSHNCTLLWPIISLEKISYKVSMVYN